ncbi:hypothetical protein B0T16DRAFT_462682 [Cercophora newfieldiana]|uniref:K Homology domain-containing protein n=1 Tax=Cercophora newfieldiana TaxID=92897 RepID=A0AA39XT82_9PEZI|nr:hypothetical protein B0T16DRAFT_462682 [Cercophora newfieldiana]
MANQQPDISSILRLLGDAAARPATSTPTQSQSGLPAPAAPPMSANPYPPPQNPYPSQAPSYQPPPSYPYPQPSASGSIDLSTIRPVNSGTLPLTGSIADAIAQAKQYAAEKGLTPYERQAQAGGYQDRDPRQVDHRQYPRSRSKSPPPRGGFRDNANPYRDERRGDHGPSRDYGRERSFSPGRGRQGFSPRGASGGRDRSPLRGKDDGNVETIPIEASLVGLIIGRQGENLRRVEKDSGCRVQFIPPVNPSEEFRQCKITGPRAQREEAKDMINRIIQDSGMRTGRGGPDMGGHGHAHGGRDSRPAPPPSATGSKEGEDTLQIMVPDRTVGLIIGRGGETIRDLQERSGCHINIVGENKSINGLRPVNLVGAPAATRHAKELILEIVDSDSRNGNNPGAGGGRGGGGRGDNFGGPGGPGGHGGGGHDKINDSIYVPSDAVGMIIGKGGETIREMQNNTGCKINVSQSSGPGEVEREIGLVGSREAITRAKQAIEDKVEAARQKSGGGGRGRGQGQGQPRDYDNPSYGQPSNNNSAPQNVQPGGAAPAAAGGQADPYAIYGGYENYVALWWQSQMNQQAQGGAGQAPGTS